MLKLSQSVKFKKDLVTFKEGIIAIKNPLKRAEYEKTLEQFIIQCRLIDNAHSPEYNGRIQPENIRETVIELNKLRKRLQNFLDQT